MAPSNDVKKKFQELMNNRKKQKKNEDLAQQILGKDRRTSNSPAGSISASSSSFASRVGITKRSSQTTPRFKNNLAKGTADVLEPMQIRHSSVVRAKKEKGLVTNLQDSKQVNLRPAVQPAAAQLNIRGIAAGGPCVVMASNFAPGTTAADIEVAMGNVGGDNLRCRILSASPTILAEIECADRAGAENIIASFNGASADGKTLYVYMKQGGPTPARVDRPVKTPAVVRQPTPPAPPPPASAPEPEPAPAADDIMVVDTVGDRRGAFRREFGRLESYERSMSGGHPDDRYGYGNGPHGSSGRGSHAGSYSRGSQSREPRGYHSRSYGDRY